MHAYVNNSQYVGRKIYNANNSQQINNALLPQIIEVKNDQIGSTSANLFVYTNTKCIIEYMIYKYGDHFSKAPKTVEEIHTNFNVIKVESTKNSSFVVNPFANLGLVSLEYETQYYIYMIASSSMGNSVNITIHTFTTAPLSNAVQFKFTTNTYISNDEVEIVMALADVLKIDPNRIKITSS